MTVGLPLVGVRAGTVDGVPSQGLAVAVGVPLGATEGRGVGVRVGV